MPKKKSVQPVQIERRKLPRLCLSSQQFRSSTGKLFAVSDLSQNGMSFRILDPADRNEFAVGGSIQGILNLNREKHPISAKIRNLAGDRVGCQFENLIASTKKAISQFFDPEFQGASLKPIPASAFSTLWYHGECGTELLLKRNPDGKFQDLNLYFSGVYVQWIDPEGLSTGSIKDTGESGETMGIVHLQSCLLEKDPAPDSEKLNIAKKIILSSNLPQDLRTWCVRQFSSFSR